MHMYTHACTRTHMDCVCTQTTHICTHIRPHTHIDMHTGTYIYVHRHTHVHTHVYRHMHACDVWIYTCTRTFTHMHVHVHIYIYIHIYTCTCTPVFVGFFVFLLGVKGGRRRLLAVRWYFPLTSLVCAFSPALNEIRCGHSRRHLWPFPPSTPLMETLTRSPTSLFFAWAHSTLQNAHS